MLVNLQGVTPIGKALPLRTAKRERPHGTGPLPIHYGIVCTEQLKASLIVVALPSELADTIERLASQERRTTHRCDLSPRETRLSAFGS